MSRCSWCDKPFSEVEGNKHIACERAAWSSNKWNGSIVAFILFPFALIGFAVGFAYSGLKAGFEEALGAWDQAWNFIRKPRP